MLEQALRGAKRVAESSACRKGSIFGCRLESVFPKSPDAAMKTNNILSVLNREQWLITLFQNDLKPCFWLVVRRAQENGDPSNDVYFSLMAR